MTNNGIKNEMIFVNYLNNKRVNELNIKFQELIYKEFKSINKNDIVYATKTITPEKTDIILKINSIEKRISLKIGSKNSMHSEPISEFIHFLIENNIPREIVIKYLKFQFADGTTNGTGKNRLSTEEYKEKNLQDFIEINKYFNDKKFVKKCINRFIIKGRNSNNEIDFLIFGKINDFFYLNKEEIINSIIEANNLSNSIHVGPLYIQPLSRNINHNPKYEKYRFSIQVKWYDILDDYIKYKNDKLITNDDAG